MTAYDFGKQLIKLSMPVVRAGQLLQTGARSAARPMIRTAPAAPAAVAPRGGSFGAPVAHSAPPAPTAPPRGGSFGSPAAQSATPVAPVGRSFGTPAAHAAPVTTPRAGGGAAGATGKPAMPTAPAPMPVPPAAGAKAPATVGAEAPLISMDPVSMRRAQAFQSVAGAKPIEGVGTIARATNPKGVKVAPAAPKKPAAAKPAAEPKAAPKAAPAAPATPAKPPAAPNAAHSNADAYGNMAKAVSPAESGARSVKKPGTSSDWAEEWAAMRPYLPYAGAALAGGGAALLGSEMLTSKN